MAEVPQHQPGRNLAPRRRKVEAQHTQLPQQQEPRLKSEGKETKFSLKEDWEAEGRGGWDFESFSNIW